MKNKKEEHHKLSWRILKSECVVRFHDIEKNYLAQDTARHFELKMQDEEVSY
jgi:hypothetical protein